MYVCMWVGVWVGGCVYVCVGDWGGGWVYVCVGEWVGVDGCMYV